MQRSAAEKERLKSGGVYNTATEKSAAVAHLTFQILRRCKQRKRNFQSIFVYVVVKMRFSKVAVKYLNKHKK